MGMRPSAPPSPHSARGPRWQPPVALERAGLEKGGASVAQDPPGTQGPQREWGCEQWAARAPWAGPHSEEQCGLTPTCWPRAAAQGASAGTVTGCAPGERTGRPGTGGGAARGAGWDGQPGPAGRPGDPRAHGAAAPHSPPAPRPRQRRRAPSNYLPDDASHFLQEKSQKADVIRGPLSM